MEEPAANVDAYIARFSPEMQAVLEEVRAAVRAAAPEAVEQIAYAMPAYKLGGKPLVYFAAYKSHVGFYATPTGHAAFVEELSKFKQGKGSVQFPLDEPMPLDLIGRIVRFRTAENLSRGRKK